MICLTSPEIGGLPRFLELQHEIRLQNALKRRMKAATSRCGLKMLLQEDENKEDIQENGESKQKMHESISDAGDRGKLKIALLSISFTDIAGATITHLNTQPTRRHGWRRLLSPRAAKQEVLRPSGSFLCLLSLRQRK